MYFFIFLDRFPEGAIMRYHGCDRHASTNAWYYECYNFFLHTYKVIVHASLNGSFVEKRCQSGTRCLPKYILRKQM